MTDIDIYDAYEDLPENDAFEFFDFQRVSYETIAKVLGYDVATDYLNWIRINIKG